MNQPPNNLELDFVGSATYRIVVEGYLDPSYSDRIAGMTISTTDRGNRKPLTTIVGRVRDQAELSGVLETLYSLHLTLVKVETTDGDE